MGLKHREKGVTGKRIFPLCSIDDLAQESSTEASRARGVGCTTRHGPPDPADRRRYIHATCMTLATRCHSERLHSHGSIQSEMHSGFQSRRVIMERHYNTHLSIGVTLVSNQCEFPQTQSGSHDHWEK